MTYGGCAPFGGGGPFPLGGGGPFPFAGGGAWRSVIHFQLMNWWTVTNALNRLLKIFWMLWDDGYPGGGTDKLLTEGMETTPSAWGTGEAACEAINPTKETRTTIVNLAMFTTFLLNNRMRMNKYHNRPSNKYTKATRKTEKKALRYAKTSRQFLWWLTVIDFVEKKNLRSFISTVVGLHRICEKNLA